MEGLITGIEVPDDERGRAARAIASELAIDAMTHDEVIPVNEPGWGNRRQAELAAEFLPTAYVSILALETLANDEQDQEREFERIQADAMALVDGAADLDPVVRDALKQEIRGLNGNSPIARSQALATIQRIVRDARAAGAEEAAADLIEVSIRVQSGEYEALRASLAGTAYASILDDAQDAYDTDYRDLTERQKINMIISSAPGVFANMPREQAEATARRLMEMDGFEETLRRAHENPDALNISTIRAAEAAAIDAQIASPETPQSRRDDLIRDRAFGISPSGAGGAPRNMTEFRVTAGQLMPSILPTLDDAMEARIRAGGGGMAYIDRAIQLYSGANAATRERVLTAMQNHNVSAADRPYADALELASVTTAAVALHTLANGRARGREITNEYELMQQMRRDNPRLLSAVDESALLEIASQSFGEYSQNRSRYTGAGADAAILSSAKIIASSAIARASANVRAASAALADTQGSDRSWGQQFRDGKTTLERELDDVSGMINTNFSALSRRLGGQDGIGSGEELLQILESSGVITDNHRNNRAAIEEELSGWNNENIGRLDRNRGLDSRGRQRTGQLDGQEVLDALRLAEIMRVNRGLVDSNNDGSLSQSEVAAGLALARFMNNTPGLDTNNDGLFSATEASNAQRLRAMHLQNNRLIDRDGDGQLSIQEVNMGLRLNQYILDHGDVIAQISARLVESGARGGNTLDLNGDGRVTAVEQRLDLNLDGRLDRNEAARALMLNGVTTVGSIDSLADYRRAISAAAQAAPAVAR